MALWTSFFIAFTVLLPLINPLGSALVFMGQAGDAPPSMYRSLARRIAINNIVFLAIIELLGSAILNFFGLSLPIVQLSGGLVIAAMGWATLNDRASGAGSTKQKEATEAEQDSRQRDLEQKTFYPFTFPITSGPGTLVGVLTLAAHTPNAVLAINVLAHLGIFLAIVVLSVLVYFSYAYAPRITRAISPSTAQGVLRVVAFILLCLGVQIAWNGLSVLLKTVMR